MFYFGMPAQKTTGLNQGDGSNPLPQERFILYFDILGYKAYFENKENDIMEFLQKAISIFDDINEEEKRASSVSKKLRYKTFSDNFIFVVEDEKQDDTVLCFLIQLAAHLQLNYLTKYKITVRGDICFGNIYMDERIVFGEGIVKATQLEHEAIYPRVIIENRIITEICPEAKKNDLIKIDSDEKYYVDYFHDVKIDSVFNPDSQMKKYICQLRDSVFTLLDRHGHYDRRISDPNKVEEATRVINKYIWLLVKYNEAITREKLPVSIRYDTKVNSKLYRLEVTGLAKGLWPTVAN